MSVSLTAFTYRGVQIALRIAQEIPGAQVWTLPKHALEPCQTYTNLSQWTRQQFAARNRLIFVCATGIAIRTIAPFLQDKWIDPAILAVDELGRFVIPLVSGHVGGANDLARTVARILHAQAVISTATDLNGLFAVDEWARKNGITITNRPAAKRISADLLAGRQVYARCELPRSDWPEGISEKGKPDFVVTYRCLPEEKTMLVLHPPVFAVGIGCKKGLPENQVKDAVERVFAEQGLSMDSIFCLASIDLKQDDLGIALLSKHLNKPCYFYTSDQLKQAQGTFTPSAFVHSITGVDNVCERSAVLASGGTLVVRKTVFSGVTVAVAKRAFYAEFEGKREKQ